MFSPIQNNHHGVKNCISHDNHLRFYCTYVWMMFEFHFFPFVEIAGLYSSHALNSNYACIISCLCYSLPLFALHPQILETSGYEKANLRAPLAVWDINSPTGSFKHPLASIPSNVLLIEGIQIHTIKTTYLWTYWKLAEGELL